MNVRFPPPILTTAIVLAVVPWLLPNNYAMDIAIRIAFVAVAVIGLNLLMGFAGQVSIGHAAFVALGAYGSGLAASRLSWPPMLAIPGTAAAIAVLAWLVAKPVLQLKGHSLTMATLGLGIIVHVTLVNETELTGGPDGMPVPPLTVGTFHFEKLPHWYALAAVVLWVAIVASRNLFASPCGRALRGLNGSEIAARVVGVDVGAFKARAFVASAVLASLSGSLTGHYLGFISPEMSSFSHSIELTTMVVLGGLASTFGAVLGSALLTVLPQLLGGLHGYEEVCFGLVLMSTMIFLPRGLVPTLAALLRKGN